MPISVAHGPHRSHGYVEEDGVLAFGVESVEPDVDVVVDSNEAGFAEDSEVAGFASPPAAALVSDDGASEEPPDFDA
jgi:hypothetical protein